MGVLPPGPFEGKAILTESSERVAGVEPAVSRAAAVQVEVASSWSECRRQVQDALARTGDANPFTSIPWMESWWKTWGRGKALRVHLFLREGHVIGFAPLYRESVFGIARYYFVGHRKANYLGLVCAPGDAEAVLKALLATLKSADSRALVHFMDVSSTSPTLAALERLSPEDGVASRALRLYPCPYARLADDFETFFRGAMSRKHRGQVRAAERRLASMGALSFAVSSEPDEIARGLPKLGRLHQERFRRSYNPSLRGRHASFLQDLLAAGGGDGPILACLSLDGETVAFLLGFRMGKTFIDYVPAFDPALERYSPGHVLILRLTRWLVDERYEILDFSKGEEVYKRRWSTSETHNHLVLVATGSGPTLWLAAGLETLAARLRIWLRESGKARGLKRALAALHHAATPWRLVVSRGVSVRSAPFDGQGPAQRLTYGEVGGLPLAARKALADFRFRHSDGDVLLRRVGPTTLVAGHAPSGEAIRVSW